MSAAAPSYTAAAGWQDNISDPVQHQRHRQGLTGSHGLQSPAKEGSTASAKTENMDLMPTCQGLLDDLSLPTAGVDAQRSYDALSEVLRRLASSESGRDCNAEESSMLSHVEILAKCSRNILETWGPQRAASTAGVWLDAVLKILRHSQVRFWSFEWPRFQPAQACLRETVCLCAQSIDWRSHDALLRMINDMPPMPSPAVPAMPVAQRGTIRYRGKASGSSLR